MEDIKMRKPGRIDKPLTMEPYLSVLRERLADESKGHVRKYLRAKIRMLTAENQPRKKHSTHNS
jgi:hypothetical protein